MSLARFQSSGQINADRRYDYATGLASEGEFAAAADLYAQALELAPDWAACWFAYGDMLERLNNRDQACSAFTKVLALMPEDPFGASVHLYKLGQISFANSESYVTGLFDQYATQFDTHLVEALHYRGPEILRAALDACSTASDGTKKLRTFQHFIDLGCGTGLMARALAGRYMCATGIDLSPKMIHAARSSGFYTHLHIEDLLQALVAQPKGSADLVLAADVFVYCGDLATIFAAVRQVLDAKGIFGFSVQIQEPPQDSADFILGDDYRYAHK
eukprot:gene12058-12148_t